MSMHMRAVLCFSILFFASLSAAIAARMYDAPYIEITNGRTADAVDGLLEKAERGDASAAFFLARSYQRGPSADSAQAAEWYLTSVRLGEVRAIVPYIGLLLEQSRTPETCQTALDVLERTGRSGQASALLALGTYHQSGYCTDTDHALAVRYYMGAARIDGRFQNQVDAVAADLGPNVIAGLRAIPEEFDLKPYDVLRWFLANVAPPAKQKS